MPEHEPKLELDPVSQMRAEYEELVQKLDRPLMSLEEAHAVMNGAVPFFELGLKLSRIGSAESEALIAEIKQYTGDRQKQLHDALVPKGGTGSMKRGG